MYIVVWDQHCLIQLLVLIALIEPIVASEVCEEDMAEELFPVLPTVLHGSLSERFIEPLDEPVLLGVVYRRSQLPDLKLLQHT